GWLREAAVLAARRLALVPESAAAREDARETVATLRFLDALKRSWKDRYFSYAGGAENRDLEEALSSLRNLSERHLGIDITEGIAQRSFGMLGAMAETVRAQGTCGRWFREHGLALVVGRAVGNPVEARLLRVVSLRRNREEEILGRRFPSTTVVGEGLLIPSYREAEGMVLGGATVGDLVFLDLEGVARWAGTVLRSRSDAAIGADLAAVRPMKVLERGERETLRFPGRVSERLGLAPDSWDDPLQVLDDFMDAARAHEFAHAADSARYLPISSHLWNGLGLFLRGGLSGNGVAAVLEGDAEIVALAVAREPRAVLATMTSFLPSRDTGPPHGRGYFDALEELIEELENDRAALVEIAPDENLLRALDRVPPDRLRAAALRVCEARGLVGE
ncbi:MAG: hypothetical protein ACYTG4_07775, partial [Planctomycetota bacterium]